MREDYYEMCETYGLTPGSDQADVMYEIESYVEPDIEHDFDEDDYAYCPRCGGILIERKGKFSHYQFRMNVCSNGCGYAEKL